MATFCADVEEGVGQRFEASWLVPPWPSDASISKTPSHWY